MFFEERLGAGLQVPGLGSEKAGGFDNFFQLSQGDFCVGKGGGAPLEEDPGDLIDACIRALGGQDGGHQQFQRIGVLKFAVGVRIGVLEQGDQLGYRGGAFFGSHGREGSGGGFYDKNFDGKGRFEVNETRDHTLWISHAQRMERGTAGGSCISESL